MGIETITSRHNALLTHIRKLASSRAYRDGCGEYLGDGVLQCQNCMQLFPIETVGTEEALGCSPISILEFTEADGTVVISEDVLAEAEPWFKNWKRTGE